MGKHKHGMGGFAILETVLVLVIIAMIGFVGWFVIRAKHNTDKTLSTATAQTVSAGPAASSGGTDNQSLQSDLNGINNANDQAAKDLNTSNSGLNDSSTFTALP